MQTNKGIAHLFLLFVVILVAIGAIGYLAYQNAQQNIRDLKTSKPAVYVNLGNDLEEIQLLQGFSQVKVFYTVISDFQDGVYTQYIEKVYVADPYLSKDSVKEVFSLRDNIANHFFSFHRLHGKHYDYFIAQSGGTSSDFAIFKSDGELITQSVSKSNEELRNWSINFDKYDSNEEVIIASLVTVANDSGTVRINPETGKVVPNSLQELGKLEN